MTAASPTMRRRSAKRVREADKVETGREGTTAAELGAYLCAAIDSNLVGLPACHDFVELEVLDV